MGPMGNLLALAFLGFGFGVVLRTQGYGSWSSCALWDPLSDRFALFLHGNCTRLSILFGTTSIVNAKPWIQKRMRSVDALELNSHSVEDPWLYSLSWRVSVLESCCWRVLSDIEVNRPEHTFGHLELRSSMLNICVMKPAACTLNSRTYINPKP